MFKAPNYTPEVVNQKPEGIIPIEFHNPVIEETQDALWLARKDFFINNLDTKGIQFSVFWSWAIDPNVYLFYDFLWIDIQAILEQWNVPLNPNSSFVVMLYKWKLVIFDGVKNTSILAYDPESKEIAALENTIINLPDDDTYIINFEDDFIMSLPEDFE